MTEFATLMLQSQRNEISSGKGDSDDGKTKHQQETGGAPGLQVAPPYPSTIRLSRK